MLKTPLSPRMHAKIRANVEEWQRQANMPEEKKKLPDTLPFITISREFGCPGYPLAVDVANTLKSRGLATDMTVYDRKLVEEISQREDIAQNLLMSLTYHTRSEMEDYLVGLLAGEPSEMELYHKLARTVVALASHGEVIIVGRGGSIITRHLKGGVHVRLVAPMEWRLKTFTERFPDKKDIATKEQFEKFDREQEAYIRKYIGEDVTNPLHYDLIINAENLSRKTQVELITQLYTRRLISLEGKNSF